MYPAYAFSRWPFYLSLFGALWIIVLMIPVFMPIFWDLIPITREQYAWVAFIAAIPLTILVVKGIDWLSYQSQRRAFQKSLKPENWPLCHECGLGVPPWNNEANLIRMPEMRQYRMGWTPYAQHVFPTESCHGLPTLARRIEGQSTSDHDACIQQAYAALQRRYNRTDS